MTAYGHEIGAQAGPFDAPAIGDAEKRPMRRTDNVPAVAGEEAAGAPGTSGRIPTWKP